METKKHNKIKLIISLLMVFLIGIFFRNNSKTYAYETNNNITNTIEQININGITYGIGEFNLANSYTINTNTNESITMKMPNTSNLITDYVVLINCNIKQNNQYYVGWFGGWAYGGVSITTTGSPIGNYRNYISSNFNNENEKYTIIYEKTNTNYNIQNSGYLRITFESNYEIEIYNIDVLLKTELYTEYALETYTQQYIEQINQLENQNQYLQDRNALLQQQNDSLENQKAILQAEIDNLYNTNEDYNNIIPFTNDNITNTNMTINGNNLTAQQVVANDTTEKNGNQIEVYSDFDLLPYINTQGANYIIYTYTMNKRYIANTYIINGIFSDVYNNQMELTFYDNNEITMQNIYSNIDDGEEDRWVNNQPFTFDKFQLKLIFPEYNQIENNHDLQYGFTIGGTYEQGYQLGIENGTATGYENGYNMANAENQNRINALQKQVETLREQVQNNFGWKQFFYGLVDIPFATMSNVLDFELFGVNLFTAFIGIITTLIVIWLIKKFI